MELGIKWYDNKITVLIVANGFSCGSSMEM